MPVYIWSCDKCSKVVEDFLTVEQMLKKRKQTVSCECGGVATRDIVAEQSGGRVVNKAETWRNKALESMAVHPTQIKEAMAHDASKGVPTKYDKFGRPLITSRGHMKQFCELHGVYDRNGGYGDAQRNHRYKDISDD